MTLQDLRDIVAYQSASMGSDEGYGELDPAQQTLVLAYINEGYMKLVNEYLRPSAIEQVTLDEYGQIPAGSLSRDVYNIKKVATTRNGLYPVRSSFAFNPLDQPTYGVLPGMGFPNQTVWVEYQYRLPPLNLESDSPLLPTEAHTLISDYATWRYMSTGNQEKQARAGFFLQRFYEGATQVRPDGQTGAAISKFY